MPLYRPTELVQFLIENGVNPKKALSQNFLIDGNILRKITETADVSPGEIIFEIGPGPGALTEQLLNKEGVVLAVEKDRELSGLLPRLSEMCKGKLYVFRDDILLFPIEKEVQKLLQPGQKAKVVANLPYSLTTPILEKLIPMNKTFSKIVIMVQEEVARRFTAKPGSSEYGSFTVFLNYFADCKYEFMVKKNSFYPPPKIDSAIVTITLKEPPQVSSEEEFFRFTRRSFQQRRKMLKSSLIELYPKEKICRSLEKVSLNPLARPEELGVEEFIRLFEELNSPD